jgi:hypothetical protein
MALSWVGIATLIVDAPHGHRSSPQGDDMLNLTVQRTDPQTGDLQETMVNTDMIAFVLESPLPGVGCTPPASPPR